MSKVSRFHVMSRPWRVGAPRSEEWSLSNCCLMSCPPWTSCNGGSITRLSSPFLPSSSRWSSQCQLLHLNLSGSPPRGPSWILKRKRTLWWWGATWGCLRHGLQKLNCFLIDWMIDCLDVDLNKSKCIINQLSNFSDFPWIHFFYRDILIYYKRISCQDN